MHLKAMEDGDKCKEGGESLWQGSLALEKVSLHLQRLWTVCSSPLGLLY